MDFLSSSRTLACRVCHKGLAAPYQEVAGRSYWCCTTCAAVFLEESQLPDAEKEHAEYLLHENDPHDAGYRNFLARLATPLLSRLAPAREGLDYGCGPGPALACMMTEAGHQVRCYDPFFHPDLTALQRTYDFITCTEVVEHFHHPAREFARLDELLRPGGWLGIMTSLLTDDGRFAEWYYRREVSHVVFYRTETLRQIAREWNWLCESVAPNVVLMYKPPH